jgi:hypothetical protein
MEGNSGRDQHSTHQEKEKENEWLEHGNNIDGINLFGSVGENETFFRTAIMYNAYEDWRFCCIFLWN